MNINDLYTLTRYGNELHNPFHTAKVAKLTFDIDKQYLEQLNSIKENLEDEAFTMIDELTEAANAAAFEVGFKTAVSLFLSSCSENNSQPLFQPFFQAFPNEYNIKEF